mmetsp:Transcript_2695/g.5835  ORF Transcript_2695/g.5835 Transcript_2695/m.5835 type:complete len:103 (+) Transcript_2695:2333-2641(+)
MFTTSVAKSEMRTGQDWQRVMMLLPLISRHALGRPRSGYFLNSISKTHFERVPPTAALHNQQSGVGGTPLARRMQHGSDVRCRNWSCLQLYLSRQAQEAEHE